jgi:hypothetical protein
MTPGEKGGERGRGQDFSNRGQGMGGGRALGPGGNCICPNCGQKSPHERGKPCFDMKCPVCGTYMTRE